MPVESVTAGRGSGALNLEKPTCCLQADLGGEVFRLVDSHRGLGPLVLGQRRPDVHGGLQRFTSPVGQQGRSPDLADQFADGVQDVGILGGPLDTRTL